MEINNITIKENSALKRDAREQLKGNWGTAILICLISTILIDAMGFIPIGGPIVNLAISGPFTLGLVSCFINLIRNEPFTIENLFNGFKNFLPAFLLKLLTAIFTILWTLLLIIPGIIAILKYSMAFYILNDNPEMSSMEIIKASKNMMYGYKWKLFCLYLSFIGWFLLCILTVGIGLLWLIPYINTSIANFYENLKEVQQLSNESAKSF